MMSLQQLETNVATLANEVENLTGWVKKAFGEVTEIKQEQTKLESRIRDIENSRNQLLGSWKVIAWVVASTGTFITVAAFLISHFVK